MKIQHKLQMLALLSSKHTSRSKKESEKSTFCHIFDLTEYLKKLLQHIINLNVWQILCLLYFLLSLKSQVIFTFVTSQFGPTAFQRLGNPCVKILPYWTAMTLSVSGNIDAVPKESTADLCQVFDEYSLQLRYHYF